jgi:hypothetical protein
VIFCRPCRGLEFFWTTNPRFHRGLLSAAPPALGQAGFESHANVMKMFEQASSTIGSRRDSRSGFMYLFLETISLNHKKFICPSLLINPSLKINLFLSLSDTP